MCLVYRLGGTWSVPERCSEPLGDFLSLLLPMAILSQGTYIRNSRLSYLYALHRGMCEIHHIANLFRYQTVILDNYGQ